MNTFLTTKKKVTRELSVIAAVYKESSVYCICPCSVTSIAVCGSTRDS